MQSNHEIIGALTALAGADHPLEIERHRRAAVRVLGTDGSELHGLIDTMVQKSLRACELERLATEDSLTGLANRRSFTTALRRELSRRRRNSGPAVVLLDLDHLKEINDQFGHAAGDRAICLVADSCVAAVRAEDVVSRLGGDELAVLLPDTDLAGAIAAADRIRAAVERCEVSGVGLKVSLGIAVAGPDGDNEAAILAKADQRMYENKRSRRPPRMRRAA